jgi:hypothetical protein
MGSMSINNLPVAVSISEEVDAATDDSGVI